MTSKWYEKLTKSLAEPKTPKPSKRHKSPRPPKGKGWQTFLEIYKSENIGQVTLRRKIRQELKEGTLISFEGTERGSNGRLGRQIWYKKTATKQ